jgi:hypothetical protein
LYKKQHYHVESIEETNINVRGVSPGPRRIKKTRVSYTPRSTSPLPARRSIEKTVASEHPRRRDPAEFDFEDEMKSMPQTNFRRPPKFSETNWSESRQRSRTPVRSSETRSNNNQEYQNLINQHQNNQDFDSLNFSNILKDQNDINFLRKNLFGRKTEFHRLFQSSRDGLHAHTFHKKCDNRGPTLCLVKSKTNNKIFGGFAEYSWNEELNQPDPNQNKFKQSFLFSLKDRNVLHLTGKNDQRALCYSPTRGPVFGKFNMVSNNGTYYTYDLCVNLKTDDNKPVYSCSQVGTTFGPVHRPINNFDSTFLAGNNYFEIEELEVYQVKF